MKKAVIIMTVLAFTTSLSAMDLYSAVDLALKSDPQFLRDKNLLDKQKELINQARAPLMPNIFISGSMLIQKTQRALNKYQKYGHHVVTNNIR
ncbi:MAG: hypothetical protein CM15mP58_09860 [Burkholderiaceae bacterium]|nr:MAG: hypothetical protein CM15mP58_09860 [Burkholderiaceae bacterium]